MSTELRKAGPCCVVQLSDGRLQFFYSEFVPLYGWVVVTRWKETPQPDSDWTSWHRFGAPGPVGAGAQASDVRPQLWTADGAWTCWKETPDPDSAWTEWQPFDLPPGTSQLPYEVDPADQGRIVRAVGLKGGRLKVFLLNEFGELSMRQKSSNAPDAGWSGWKALPWLDHRFVDIAAAEDANTVVFGTAQDNGKIFWTQNSGLESDGSVSWAPWQEIHTLFPKCAVAAIARSDGTFQVFALQCLGGIDDPRGQNGGGTTVWVGRGTPTGLTDPVNWQSFGNPMRWRTPTVSPDTFSARWLSVGLLTDARLQVWATGEAILGSDPKTPNITTWETEVSRWGLAANFVDWREFSAPDDLASLP